MAEAAPPSESTDPRRAWALAVLRYALRTPEVAAGRVALQAVAQPDGADPPYVVALVGGERLSDAVLEVQRRIERIAGHAPAWGLAYLVVVPDGDEAGLWLRADVGWAELDGVHRWAVPLRPGDDGVLAPGDPLDLGAST